MRNFVDDSFAKYKANQWVVTESEVESYYAAPSMERYSGLDADSLKFRVNKQEIQISLSSMSEYQRQRISILIEEKGSEEANQFLMH